MILLVKHYGKREAMEAQGQKIGAVEGSSSAIPEPAAEFAPSELRMPTKSELRKQRGEYLKIWFDAGLKTRLKEAAKSHGQDLPNYVRGVVSSHISGGCMTPVAIKITHGEKDTIIQLVPTTKEERESVQ